MTILITLLLCGSPKLSPFTEVVHEGEKVFVQYAGKHYELLAIDGHDTAKLLAFCKQRFGGKWQRRFAEDLCEVFDAMGHRYGRTVKLELSAGGTRVTVAKASMTRDNRQEVLKARRRRPATLTAEQVEKDVAALAEHLRAHYSYFARRPREIKIEGAQTRRAFAMRLEEYLARFGDGHTRLRYLERPREYPQLLFGVDGDDVFAFTPDRTAVLGTVRALDGVPLAKWLAQAGRFVAHGSPQYRRWRGVRFLREVGLLRECLGLPSKPTLRVTFAGGETKEFALSHRRPIYGPWPRKPSHRIGNFGYMRVAGMASRTDSFVRTLERFGDTDGLIVDLRGNGGGTRHLVRALIPHFIEKPRVVNIAKPRVAGTSLEDRFLYPVAWKGWTDGERAAIKALTFKPEWNPPFDAPWHYMVVSPGAWRYFGPVVVLVDPVCFSAADILLGAFKGIPNVTLMGLPSGGGSGRARPFRLPNSGIEVRVSSMASFQPNGKLYDGNGVTPDVVLAPKPADWVGKDSVLDAAVARLRRKR